MSNLTKVYESTLNHIKSSLGGLVRFLINTLLLRVGPGFLFFFWSLSDGSLGPGPNRLAWDQPVLIRGALLGLFLPFLPFLYLGTKMILSLICTNDKGCWINNELIWWRDLTYQKMKSFLYFNSLKIVRLQFTCGLSINSPLYFSKNPKNLKKSFEIFKTTCNQI